MIKDALLLIAGVAVAALSWPLFGYRPFGPDPDVAFSNGGMALFVGLGLIVFAIADWWHRRRNAKRS